MAPPVANVKIARLSPDNGALLVVAQRISSDGSLLAQANGIRLASGVAKSVAWDGLQYDVALASHVYSANVTPYDLFVTHVAPNGPIESLTPLAVASNTTDPYASLTRHRHRPRHHRLYTRRLRTAVW